MTKGLCVLLCAPLLALAAARGQRRRWGGQRISWRQADPVLRPPNTEPLQTPAALLPENCGLPSANITGQREGSLDYSFCGPLSHTVLIPWPARASYKSVADTFVAEFTVRSLSLVSKRSRVTVCQSAKGVEGNRDGRFFTQMASHGEFLDGARFCRVYRYPNGDLRTGATFRVRQDFVDFDEWAAPEGRASAAPLQISLHLDDQETAHSHIHIHWTIEDYEPCSCEGGDEAKLVLAQDGSEKLWRSPCYPLPYGRQHKCRLSVEAPKGMLVELELHDFRLGGANSPMHHGFTIRDEFTSAILSADGEIISHRTQDSLTLQGMLMEENGNLTELGRSRIPEDRTILSSGESLELRFEASGWARVYPIPTPAWAFRVGFRAVYPAVAKKVCATPAPVTTGAPVEVVEASPIPTTIPPTTLPPTTEAPVTTSTDLPVNTSAELPSSTEPPVINATEPIHELINATELAANATESSLPATEALSSPAPVDNSTETSTEMPVEVGEIPQGTEEAELATNETMIPVEAAGNSTEFVGPGGNATEPIVQEQLILPSNATESDADNSTITA